MRILLVILLSSVLCGCYPSHFVRSDVTQEQSQKDYYECTVQAGQESSAWGGNPLILDQMRAECMKARGYTGVWK